MCLRQLLGGTTLDVLRKSKLLGARSDKRRTEDGGALWTRCQKCHEFLYVKEYARNLNVCPKCGHHGRLGAAERVAMLLDPDSFVEIDGDLRPTDPLGFVCNDKSYVERLREAHRSSGLSEAVLCGTGTIHSQAVVLAVMDFSFLGASMGSVVGEKVTRAIERSLDEGKPFVAVSASGGARMHEGVLSLMQMAKTTNALAELGSHGIPFISILTDPTTGGVMASFASLGDITMAEPGAMVGFAGARVIEQTTRQKLPGGFQTAEFAMEHGMIDLVVQRRQLRDMVGLLLSLYGGA